MDKKEYKNIFEAVKTHTGKEVEFVGDAKVKKEKEKNKNEGQCQVPIHSCQGVGH